MKTLKIAAVAATLALAGCTSTESKAGASATDAGKSPASAAATSSSSSDTPSESTTESPSSSETSSNTSSSTTSSESSASESSSSDGSGSDSAGTTPFGSTYKWPDGVSATVSKPQPFTPSENASKEGNFTKFVVVEVEVHNGTKTPLKSFDVSTTATTGSQQSNPVFDIEKGIDLPSADILPGRSLKWKEAYGVEANGDLVLSVEHGYDSPPAYFN